MNHWILFTGHMIDTADRAEPRFPAAKEKAARRAIKKLLLKEKSQAAGALKGIAGGACGGDILFHELCMKLNIPSELYLALPVEEFKKSSVSYAGKGWDKRFDRLREKLPVYILPEAGDDNSYSVWERANTWMLTSALKDGGNNMSLMALWDGKGGDGSGGTEHMVQLSKDLGASVHIIDITKL